MHLLLRSHAVLFNACRRIWLKHQAVLCTVWYHVRRVATVTLEIDRLNGPVVFCVNWQQWDSGGLGEDMPCFGAGAFLVEFQRF